MKMNMQPTCNESWLGKKNRNSDKNTISTNYKALRKKPKLRDSGKIFDVYFNKNRPTQQLKHTQQRIQKPV